MTSNRYPAPQDPTWMLRGICADEPDLMSPREDDVKGIAQARRICGNCPVRQDCLNSAMRDEAGADHPMRDGVRGGFTPAERYSAYRNRRYPTVRKPKPAPAPKQEKKEPKPKRKPGRQPKPAKCGTMRGYRAHRRRGEDPCKACSAANAERVRQVREKNAGKPKAPRKPRPAWAKKPGPAAKPIEHGTEQGVHAHKNRNIPICDECRPVRVAMQREYRAQLRAATERARHGLAA